MNPSTHRQPALQARLRTCLAFVAAAALLMCGSAQAAGAGAADATLDPALRAALAQATDTSTVRVIIHTTAGSVAPVRAHIQASGNVVAAEHQFIGAVTAQLRAQTIRELQDDPFIDHISLDAVVRSMAGPPVKAGPINEPLLSTLGLTNRAGAGTGTGVGVAVLDSGVQSTPGVLMPAGSFDFTGGGQPGAGSDAYGHGTHVSGLIAASSARGDGMVGISPGVRLFSMKVLDANGHGLTSTVLQALEFLLDNRGSLGIDVVNLSLGHPITEPAGGDPLVQAVELLSRKGLIVVVAAGNWGRNASGVAAYAGITSPGNAPSALTVGALDTNQTITRSDDRVPAYSSRGPAWYDGVAKPDVVAPGHNLVSIAAPSSSLDTRYPDQRLSVGGAQYLRLSGTSMATAVTSGVVALLIEQHRRTAPTAPPLTPNEVKAILQFTALPVTGSDALTQGAGALNATGALALVAALTGDADANLRTTGTVPPVTTIGSEVYVWNQAVIWGTTVVWGTTVYANEAAWGAQAVWGSTVVWGTGWPSADDLVWGQGTTWATNTVWQPIVGPSSVGLPWAELVGQTVVWGTGGGPY
ncbi:MAG: S8 family serine peptidase [Vicinamibacterales bacterium]